VISGQVGLLDGNLVDGGVVAETRQALANMKSLLEREGASLHDVVKTTVFIRHISDYAGMNDAYLECFGSHRPARATVAVAGLPVGAQVEIEGWAWVGPTQ